MNSLVSNDKHCDLSEEILKL